MKRVAFVLLVASCGARSDPDAPALLSETGLYSDFAKRTLAKGVIGYTPRWELWSDGADKERWLSIPMGTKIDTSDVDEWLFPVGTRAWKQFKKDGRVVETRLLLKVHERAGGWFQVAYLWDADGREARAMPDGKERALGTSHDVPSRDDCGRCHDNVRDTLIGVSAVQLASDLPRLAGMLSRPPVGEYRAPGDGVVQAALGTLHGNCGHCHNGRAMFRHPLAMRLMLGWNDRVVEKTPVYTTTINAEMNHTMEGDIHLGIVPGNPDQSQLAARMALRDDWAMPPVCTRVADGAGVATVREWIRGLK